MPRLPKREPKSAKRARMHAEMRKYKHGTLHSGSKSGPVVTDPKQAIAISLHQSGQSKRNRKVGRRKGTRKRGGKRG